jgi:hypothetical protein
LADVVTASFTELRSGDVGLVAHGCPEDVARLIEHGRELHLSVVGLVTDGGLFFVATEPAWELRGVERG